MKQKARGVSPQLNSSSNSAVTQPVGEARNVRRNQQIKALHLEFEDLKKKIKDVQTKNERIIQNIHKQYDFKKKPQTAEYMTDTNPIVHYDLQKPTIADNAPSDLSESESRPRPKKQPSIKRNAMPSFHQSIQYRKTEHLPEEESESNKGSNSMPFRPPSASQLGYSAGSQYVIQPPQPQEQFQVSQFSGINPYQISMQFPPYPSQGMAVSQVGSFYNNGFPLEDALRRERQKVKALEQELQERENDAVALKRLQKKYSSLTATCSDTVEQCLEEFFQEALKQRLVEIDKAVKKNENKLKKLQLRLKDREQAQKSRRLIQQHRSKRSHSRSKRQSSPRQNYNSLTNMPRMPSKRTNQSMNIPNEPPKSKQSEQSRSSQQFDQIANQYQQMIKSKTKEVEAYEVRLRQKEKELIQMTSKCQKLEMRVASDTSESSKSRRRSSDKEENLLANLEFDPEKNGQILALKKRINELQDSLQAKQKEISLKDVSIEKNNKKIGEYEAKIKKSDNEFAKLKEQYKRLEKQTKFDENLSNISKKLQKELQLKQKEYFQLKQKFSKNQNEKIQKECENITLSNKVKKLQTLLSVKEEKICELQKIIQSNVGGEGDILEKSMYLERIDQQDLHNLQADKQRLEQDLARQREQIFLLQKANEQLKTQCQDLKANDQAYRHELETLQIQNQSMRITIKAQEFEKYRPETPPLKQLLEEDCLSQQEQNRLREELEEARTRLEESQSLLKLQSQKTFEENRKVLKLTSQLNYFQEQLAEREDRYQKLKREHEEGKANAGLLSQQLQEREGQLEVERRVNAEKIREIEAQWLQFEQEVRTNQQQDLNTSRDPDELRNSRHFSQESFVNYRSTYNSLNAENERLQQRLKQTEKVIEVQKEMEDKIVSEYRGNVDKLKAQLREKSKEYQRIQEDSEGLRRRLRTLQQSEARLKDQIREGSRNNGDQMLLGNSNQRLQELQAEVVQLRDLNSRLSAVEQELFGQLAAKEQQVQNLIRVVSAKERRLQELEDILELKEMNFSSHISQSQHNRSKVRESLQSQSSLRYSVLSTANRDRTMELELSEAGESFFDQNQSMLSNVSEVFGRDQFPYEKMHLKRVQQRRLFEKTAAYIKSLKKAIDEKNKRIRLLERKIDSLRNSQLIRKDIYEVRAANDESDDESFRDYLSVQLERDHSQRFRMKQLEHETKLTIQENNLLNNQIESLQEEIMKAEEQENSLMKLKDLYKDEIKNLIKQNQDQAKLFEEELKKQKTKFQQADSIQKMQAIKQIFFKIVGALVTIENEGPKAKKRDERRKELEDFLKVCCNLLTYDQSVRQQLLATLKQYRK